MLELKKTLYHGSISEILKIDVSQGRDKRDFGKGFYMACNKKQAINMMHKKYKETLRRYQNKKTIFSEHLYKITLNINFFNSLNIKIFEIADLEWLDFILTCREKGGCPHNYDLVIGPTADDNTMLCLKTYWDGFYGKVGSIEAKEILLKNLETKNLGIQYFISKQHIIDNGIKEITEIDWS